MSSSNLLTTVIITLVHGTWARGLLASAAPSVNWSRTKPENRKPLWFEDGSDFCTRLQTSLGAYNIRAEVCSFEWSGANSILERERVAHFLAEHITNVTSRSAETKHIVIAHSHGGNIATKAASLLADNGTAINLVTLATPFLGIFEIPAGSKQLKGMTWTQIALSAGLSSMALLAAYSMAPDFNDLSDNFFTLLPFLLLAIVFVPLFVAALIIEIVINPYSGDDYFAVWRRRPALLRKATITCPNKNLRLLVVRAVGDEASRALVMARAGNRTSRQMLRLFGVVIVLFDIFGIDLLALMSGEARLYIYFIGLAPLLAIMAAGAFKSAFGRELFLGAFRCDVSARSMPPKIGSSTERVRLREEPHDLGRRLHHSIYEHRGCTRAVAKWIAHLVKPAERA